MTFLHFQRATSHAQSFGAKNERPADSLIGTLGVFVLPLTLYATTYSGVTFVGLPAEGAKNGFYAYVLKW